MSEDSERTYIDGMANAFDIAMNRLEKTLSSLDEVMGIYMDDDLNRYKDKVAELSLMYTVVRSLMSNISDDYFEGLTAAKVFDEDNN